MNNHTLENERLMSSRGQLGAGNDRLCVMFGWVLSIMYSKEMSTHIVEIAKDDNDETLPHGSRGIHSDAFIIWTKQSHQHLTDARSHVVGWRRRGKY